jgi:hypothetical protein
MTWDEEDKAWLGSLFGSLNAKIDAVEARVDAVDAKIDRVETNLLTEFHKWASPTDAKMRVHTASMHAFELQLEALADRIEKLERRAH